MAFLERYAITRRWRAACGGHEARRRFRTQTGFLRRQLENRVPNFLFTARETIFGQEQSPYREMFRIAGCEYGDLESAVRRHGLDQTLAQLLDAAVTLSHDEFDSTLQRVSTAGRITATTATSRQIQIAARWAF